MLGENIKREMAKTNITQRELAKRVGITEVSMSRYVSNDRVPKGPLLMLIAHELNCTVEQLLMDNMPQKYVDVTELTDEEITAIKVIVGCMIRSHK